ncbi:MAG: hypothetical protein KKA07_07550 [Bacteroidetes bacterium]|nr:hypothetical protein [Bacteroidota bacterium]MBU1718916.1 hypothetical protein [Bacteroidota bacterium]
MKRFRNLLVLFGGLWVALQISSCATSSVSMQILVPAQISVPQHIQKIAVANRSLPAKGQGVWNFVEGFLSGESVFADREGSSNCIRGAVSQLNLGPRFQAVLADDLDLKGTGTRQFPVMLSWAEVEKICKDKGVDALVLLETFDSDIAFSKKTENVTKTVNGKEVVVPEFLSNLRINVNAGWRVYDPANKQIIDESSFMDDKGWDTRGATEAESFNRLPSKRSAINESGYFAGEQFAIRISPGWLPATRSYYTKGHDDFKIAREYVRAGNWDEAAKIWNPLTTNPDKKIAGRACYNMAVACEMKGELEAAVGWAQKSFRDCGLKAARSYFQIINKRLLDQKKLKEQMGE